MKRFDVFLANLEPTIGTEIRKTRPCLVISPDELHSYVQTVIIAPMTTKSHAYPTRIECSFEDRTAYIVLDQIRTLDKQRLIKYLGRIDSQTQSEVLHVLAELFAE